jgi:hypothetical protein
MENAGTSKQLEAILMEHAGLSKCLLNVQEHQNTIIPLQNSCGRSGEKCQNAFWNMRDQPRQYGLTSVQYFWTTLKFSSKLLTHILLYKQSSQKV